MTIPKWAVVFLDISCAMMGLCTATLLVLIGVFIINSYRREKWGQRCLFCAKFCHEGRCECWRKP